MSDYTPITDFSAKDALISGNPDKVIYGADIDAETAAIATAIASKVDDTGLVNSSTGFAALVDPNADRIAFWDDSAGSIAWLVPSTGLAISGTNLSLSFLGLEALVDPNADRIAFWDDSAGAFAWLTASTGLAISTTNISLSHLGLEALVDPNADRIAFWDDSAGAFAWLAPTSALTITATTLDVDETVLDHDILTNFVADEHVAHSGVTLTAGAGLTGGGTIAASRSFAVDFDGQTEIDVATLAAADLLMVYDASAAGFKKVKLQSIGTRIQAASTTTLALTDGNSTLVNTGASNYTVTVPANATVAMPIGTVIGFIRESTGTITIAAAGGVTINSIGSLLDIQTDGLGVLIKTATNTWLLAGDLE